MSARREFFVVLTGYGHESREWIPANTATEALAKALAKHGVTITITDQRTPASNVGASDGAAEGIA